MPLEFSLAIGVQNTDVVLKFMLDRCADGQEGRDRQDPRRLRRPARPVQRLRRCRRPAFARRLRQGDRQEIRGSLPEVGRRRAGNGSGVRRPDRHAEAARGMARGRRRHQRRAQQRRHGVRSRADEVPARQGRRRQQAQRSGLCAAAHRGAQPQLRSRDAAAGAWRRPKPARQRRHEPARARHHAQSRPVDRGAGGQGRRPRRGRTGRAIPRSKSPSARTSCSRRER